MLKDQKYIFVLWGDKFEEMSAVTFITQLRQHGLRVKVVGLSPKPICGCHGLALVPDLTLDEALPLANRVICLIIPQSISGLNSLTHEPRLGQLFKLAGKHGAKFILSATNGVNFEEPGFSFPTGRKEMIFYPGGEKLLSFTQELIQTLQQGNDGLASFTLL